MCRWLLLVVAAHAKEAWMERSEAHEAAVIEAARGTIDTLRAMMCGRVAETQELVLGVAAGRERRALEKRLAASLASAGLENVGGATLATERLWGAAETDDFEFSRSFDDIDAVVGGLVAAHWQELLAAYPRARLILALSDERLEPDRSRLERCAARTSEPRAVDEAIALYGSACPSALQRAKYEDQLVHEILENAPNLLVVDTRDYKEAFESRVEAFVRRGVATRGSVRWEPDFARLLPQTSLHHPLVVCPGAGATATKSLAKGLRHAGLHRVDHNKLTQGALELASEDDDFDWVEALAKFDAVLDTPVPGYWLEMVQAFPSSRVVLTVRTEYDRGYASRVEAREWGVTQADWSLARDAREDPAHVQRRHAYPLVAKRENDTAHPPKLAAAEACSLKQTCRSACRDYFDDARRNNRFFQALDVLSAFGDRHCRVAGITDHLDLVKDYARAPVSILLADRAGNDTASKYDHRRQIRNHKGRLSLYGTLCPSKVTAFKIFNNNNRHILRRTPKKRRLLMDITKSDGYDLLCPFLGLKPDQCPQEPFPNAASRGLSDAKAPSASWNDSAEASAPPSRRRRRRLLSHAPSSEAASGIFFSRAAAAAPAQTVEFQDPPRPNSDSQHRRRRLNDIQLWGSNHSCLCDHARGFLQSPQPYLQTN